MHLDMQLEMHLGTHFLEKQTKCVSWGCTCGCTFNKILSALNEEKGQKRAKNGQK
jgi:hypothetical protein